MSITLVHRYLVRDFFAVPFLTPQGIGYHHFCRNSFLHVPQRVVPLLGLKKRSQKPYFKPSTTGKPQQSNPDPVHDEKPKPVQAEAPPPPPPTKEPEYFDGSVTMGAAPSPRHVPIPMFYVREKIKESSKLTKT
ncbi:hypothetical protein CARUB_v10025492mg [Capsella rubella]|uniref:Uncharacterized protein n=1 Tax=Capsella rubella TaxID=81985 RepID=R0HYP7_9BRAS|nr:uncharacterized protein LOC17888080 [Capsella rubella]EOA29218.1 hypothetical protein CARUB_v10025492mg [Capsella rubella]